MARPKKYPHRAYIDDNDLNIGEFPQPLQNALEAFTNLFNKTNHKDGQVPELVEISEKLKQKIEYWHLQSERKASTEQPAESAIEGKDKKDKILADFWNEGVKYVSLAELKAAGYPISMGSPTPKTAHFKLSYVKDKTSKRFGMYQLTKIK